MQGLTLTGSRSTMPPKKGKKDPNAKRHRAAVPLQCFARVILAKVRMKRAAKKTWMRVFDPAFKMYFWFNKNNGSSQWTVPLFCKLFTEVDIAAALLIGKVIRGFNGRRKTRREVYSQYTRYFDANVAKFYWIKHSTGLTFWKCSPWLQSQNIPMPLEDEMLYNSHKKIQDLESALKAKDEEIIRIRQSTYEELEPQVLADRVADVSLEI